MVVVPKKNGTITICVDLKPLNESMKREAHSLPAVGDTLAQLAGAKIFSTLDANSAFDKSHWHHPPDYLQPSSPLMGVIVLTNCRLVYVVPQSISKDKWRKHK